MEAGERAYSAAIAAAAAGSARGGTRGGAATRGASGDDWDDWSDDWDKPPPYGGGGGGGGGGFKVGSSGVPYSHRLQYPRRIFQQQNFEGTIGEVNLFRRREYEEVVPGFANLSTAGSQLTKL
eukprot:SAG11_NODE_1641_length_4530_cov_6.481607_2_plen_123_part_00